MKEQKLCEISPYLFDDHLIISLDKRWIDVCNEIPRFTVIIDTKGRLILVGPSVDSKHSTKFSLSKHKIFEDSI